jgi:DNA-binding HxlR family transcriptional regulator
MSEQAELLEKLTDIFKALGDPTRLRIMGLLVEAPRTGKELSDLLHVTPPTLSHHLAKLTDAGLVSVQRDGQNRIFSLNEKGLGAISRAVSTQETAAQVAALPDGEKTGKDSKVLKDFFAGGKLKQIPAQRKKRVVVLQHLMERFSPDQSYQEKEVNALLKEAHEDVATLRRELVDYGYLTRVDGLYSVSRSLPERSTQVAQETGSDERAWLRGILGQTAE